MINEAHELRWQDKAFRALGPHWQEILRDRDLEAKLAELSTKDEIAGRCPECGETLVSGFNFCPTCDEGYFWQKVRELGAAGILNWLDEITETCHGQKNFYMDDSRLTLEYSLDAEYAADAEKVLKTYGADYRRNANSIVIQLKAGSNYRLELVA